MTSLLLVVEDPICLELIIEALEDDYDVQTADDVGSAVVKAQFLRPDLIIVDVSRRFGRRVGAISELRAEPTLQDTPVIGISPRAGAAIEHADGCDAYIAKPVDDELLRATIAGLLRARRGRR
jgi:CheY-like chemotaxis protein